MNAHAQALVVSGFLGSGKTTLVRHLLEESQRDGIRTAVVSNEFGELGIDEALLASSEGDFIELSGGCVCCRLSDDLLKTLQQLWERARPERIIVETSGVALPYDTLINFWRDPVREWAVDESSVVVVSAEQVASGRDLDRTFEDQVCSADLIVVSKSDLVSEEDAQRVERHLAAMQPEVAILRASFGDVDSRVFFPPDPGSRAARSSSGVQAAAGASTRSDAPGVSSAASDVDRDASDASPHSHPHPHDEYFCAEIAFAPGIAEADLLRALEERSALRAKGFVETASGLRLVQGVAGRIEITEPDTAPPAGIVGRVVVIERRRLAANEAGDTHTHAHPGAAGETR